MLTSIHFSIKENFDQTVEFSALRTTSTLLPKKITKVPLVCKCINTICTCIFVQIETPIFFKKHSTNKDAGGLDLEIDEVTTVASLSTETSSPIE
jgi:hypothetical protein